MTELPKPFLTIAIPVFNGESVLAPMLASLDEQDWDLFEVRFGNDGSTDGSRRVLDEFAARHPGKVFVENHENIGAGPSRNRMLEQARGEYIWFCDADDELAPGSVARIVEILYRRPVDYLALGYGKKPENPRKEDLEVPPVQVSTFELLLSMPCATVAKIVKTSLLRDRRIEFPAIKVGEDLVFSIRAACLSATALFWYAKPYWVRKRPDSASGTVDESFCEDLSRSIALVEGAADRFPSFKRAIEVQLLDYWNYFLRRLRDDASPEVQKKWIPVVKGALHDLASANDNPLLRIPRAFSRREGEALTREKAALKNAKRAERAATAAQASEQAACKREQAACKREQAAVQREQAAIRREQAAIRRERAARERERSIRASLSWRVTAPLRAVGRIFAGKRKTGKENTP